MKLKKFFLPWIKDKVAPIETAALADGLAAMEAKVRPMCLDFMMEFTNESWEVSFITCSWEGSCLYVHIWSPSPAKIIGVGGERMAKFRGFIGQKLGVPVYVDARHKFDPFKDPLPK